MTIPPLDRAKETVRMIETFVEGKSSFEKAVLEIESRKAVLRKKIEEYVKVIYSHLFDYVESINMMLSQKNIGEAYIIIEDKQPYLFPENPFAFVQHKAKNFTSMIGSIGIIIGEAEEIKLSGEVVFGSYRGEFKWEDGTENPFFRNDG